MVHGSIRVARLALAAAALLLVGTAAQAESEAAKPVIVKIHADWCGTCTKLNPTMVQLQEQLGDEATVVTLDVTDRAAVEASAAEAERLGIRKFFDSYKGKTGTVGVIASNGKIVQVYKGELDVDKYVDALAVAKQEA